MHSKQDEEDVVCPWTQDKRNWVTYRSQEFISQSHHQKYHPKNLQAATRKRLIIWWSKSGVISIHYSPSSHFILLLLYYCYLANSVERCGMALSQFPIIINDHNMFSISVRKPVSTPDKQWTCTIRLNPQNCKKQNPFFFSCSARNQIPLVHFCLQLLYLWCRVLKLNKVGESELICSRGCGVATRYEYLW